MPDIIDLTREEYQKKVFGLAENPAYPNLTHAPLEWFNSKPDWWDNISQHSIYVDDKGRVAGLVNNWEQCYLNDPERCFKADPNQDLSKMYQSNATTVEGNIIPVSVLSATYGHENFNTINGAIAYNQGYVNEYGEQLSQSNDIMAHQLCYGQYHPVEEGLAFFGAMFPHVDSNMVQRINASAISGSWAEDATEGKQTFLGATFVNRGALPLQISAGLKLYTIGRKSGDRMPETCKCKKENKDHIENIAENIVDTNTDTTVSAAITDNIDTVDTIDTSVLIEDIASLTARVDELEAMLVDLYDMIG